MATCSCRTVENDRYYWVSIGICNGNNQNRFLSNNLSINFFRGIYQWGKETWYISRSVKRYSNIGEKGCLFKHALNLRKKKLNPEELHFLIFYASSIPFTKYSYFLCLLTFILFSNFSSHKWFPIFRLPRKHTF